jgi:hypothetical protein
MLAYRLLQAQTPPEFEEVREPQPGPGQAVVRVAASGLCNTDLTVISRDRSHWKDEAPPFTLGHEIAGRIEESWIWQRWGGSRSSWTAIRSAPQSRRTTISSTGDWSVARC